MTRRKLRRENEDLRDALGDEVSVAVNDPESLGVLAEARPIGLARLAELAHYLPVGTVQRLGALVADALVARLPGRAMLCSFCGVCGRDGMHCPALTMALAPVTA